MRITGALAPAVCPPQQPGANILDLCVPGAPVGRRPVTPAAVRVDLWGAAGEHYQAQWVEVKP